MVQRYWISRANEAILIEYFSKELTDLADKSLEYWTLGYKAKTKEDEETRRKAQLLEQKIKGAIKNLYSALTRYSKRYCKRVDFTPLVGEINEACTGGFFEAGERDPDRHRYLSVINTTHRLRWALFERRV
jgi:hypothetical protein